jgi:hypothetical protein
LSLGGASIFIDQNVFIASKVVMLLAIPPSTPGQKEMLIVTHCRMIHTVFDSGKRQFRIGMHFLSFAGEGKKVLSGILSKRAALDYNTRPYA